MGNGSGKLKVNGSQDKGSDQTGPGKKDKGPILSVNGGQDEDQIPPKIEVNLDHITSKIANGYRMKKLAEKDARNDMEGLPEPEVQRLKKSSIFNPKHFHYSHKLAKSITRDHMLSYEEFFKHLTNGSSDSLQNAWTLYIWVCWYLDLSNPTKKVPSNIDGPITNVRAVASKKSDLCLLYKHLCLRMKIPCVLIKGYIKNEFFEIGMSIQDAKKCESSWLFIFLRGHWHYVNPLLGANATNQAKDFFFLTEARDFNQFCFPEEDKWQLQEFSKNWDDFSQGPLCQPDLLAMKLFVLKPWKGVIHGNSTVRVEVSVPPECSNQIILHYKLTGCKYIPLSSKKTTQMVSQNQDKPATNFLQDDGDGDTDSNDSMPISPYGSLENLTEIVIEKADKKKNKNVDNQKISKLGVVTNGSTRQTTQILNVPLKNEGTHIIKNASNLTEESIKKGPFQTHIDNSETLKVSSEISLLNMGYEQLHDFPKQLENYVYMSYLNDRYLFEINLPVGGEYYFDILGGKIDFSNPAENVRKLPTLCRFKLVKDGVQLSPPPLCPVATEVGWGPTPFLARFGLKPSTHLKGQIIVENKDEHTIQFEIAKDFKFSDVKIQSKLKSNLIEAESLLNRIKHYSHSGSFYIKFSLPRIGKYALKIYAKLKGDKGFKNILNYMIICGLPQNNSIPEDNTDHTYSRRMLRERLLNAINYGTEPELCHALNNFRAHAVPNKGDADLAEKRLEYFTIKKELKLARERRHKKTLEETISRAKRSEFASELREDIAEAENLFGQMEKLAGFQHKALKLNRDTVLEIGSYARPMPVILDTMKAVLILLNESPSDVQKWDDIVTHLLGNGKDDILRRMNDVIVEEIPIGQVAEAKTLLDKYDETEARETSNGIALFFRWANHICQSRDQAVDIEAELRETAHKKLKATMTKALSLMAIINSKKT